jgi:hypothetical protein
MALANWIVMFQLYRTALPHITSKQNMAKYLSIIAYCFEGMAAMMAGWFHYEHVHTKHPDGEQFWRYTMLALVASGACRGLAMSALVDSPLVANVFRKATLVGYMLLTVNVIQTKVPFLVIGISTGALPPFLLTCMVLLTRYNDKFELANATLISSQRAGVVGLLALGAGTAVFVHGLEHCATPCPENCAFAPPNFNHNAVFHSLQVVAILALGASMRLLLISEDQALVAMSKLSQGDTPKAEAASSTKSKTS